MNVRAGVQLIRLSAAKLPTENARHKPIACQNRDQSIGARPSALTACGQLNHPAASTYYRLGVTAAPELDNGLSLRSWQRGEAYQMQRLREGCFIYDIVPR